LVVFSLFEAFTAASRHRMALLVPCRPFVVNIAVAIVKPPPGQTMAVSRRGDGMADSVRAPDAGREHGLVVPRNPAAFVVRYDSLS